MTMSATPVLELCDVARHYPGRPPVLAVDGVSLSVHTGELLAITGPSGSGKSTLLNLVGTLDRPTGGEVFIDGVPTSKLSDRAVAGLRAARLGFVFQQFNLLAGMSTVENVATGLLYRGLNRKLRRRNSVEALQRVGLGHRLDHRPNQLSGGERQRVAIARALVGEPAIVLADEPTGNLDSRTSAEIIGLLHRLHDEGSTILVITHDPDLAASLPRRIAMLDGQLATDSASDPNPTADTTGGDSAATGDSPATGDNLARADNLVRAGNPATAGNPTTTDKAGTAP